MCDYQTINDAADAAASILVMELACLVPMASALIARRPQKRTQRPIRPLRLPKVEVVLVISRGPLKLTDSPN